MTAAIATNEPTKLRAGLNWDWERTFADYPATVWTLTYYFKNASANFSFAATANGSAHRVARTPAQTTAIAAGVYSWVAAVSDGVNKYEVDEGTLEVLADYLNASSLDGRSHARKVLTAIEAVIEARASKDQEEYQIEGRMLKRTPIPELLKLRQIYRAEVAGETQAEALANGSGIARKIQVRL